MKKAQDNETCKIRCKCNKIRWVVGTALFLFVNVIVLDVIPNNAYLESLKLQVDGTRVSLNLLNDLCVSFEGASEEEKASKGFYSKFNDYSRRYINNTAELIKIGEQVYRLSPEINKALLKFDRFNNQTLSEITKTNSCPAKLLTQDDLWILELETTMAFPNSLPEYFSFYIRKFVSMLSSDQTREKKELLKLENNQKAFSNSVISDDIEALKWGIVFYHNICQINSSPVLKRDVSPNLMKATLLNRVTTLEQSIEPVSNVLKSKIKLNQNSKQELGALLDYAKSLVLYSKKNNTCPSHLKSSKEIMRTLNNIQSQLQ